MNDTSSGNGIFCEATCGLYELTKGRDVTIHLVLTRTHDCTSDFYEIFVAIKHRIHPNRVGILELKLASFKFVEAIYAHYSTCLSDEGDVVAKSITSESTCVFNQGVHALRLFHFVEHGTFYLARNVY